MATIDGLGPAGPLGPKQPLGTQGRRTAGFAVPSDTGAATDPAAIGTAGTAAAARLGMIDSLLLLQEDADPPARDRAARRRAQELLQALAALQRAVLSAGEADAVHQLERLLRDLPQAADPALADLAAAVTLRARVELARRGR